MIVTGDAGASMASTDQRFDVPSHCLVERGFVKSRPGDFIVDEIPLYHPTGSGEHLYLLVEKTNLSHEAMITALMHHFDVPRRAIGTAGRKDKLAITRQWVSVHLHQNPSKIELTHDKLRIIEVDRHTNKLRIGHLQGNRFRTRIRQLSPTRLPAIKDRIASLRVNGLPNYFDTQRFGVRGLNHLLGRALIANEPYEVVRLLTEFGGLDQWPMSSPERRAAMWAEQGLGAAQIARRLGQKTRQFWMSALQSAVFNRVLEQRVEGSTLTTLCEGDLAWKHDSGSVFRVTSEVLQDIDTVQRLAAIAISPSGPMWGSRMTRCGESVDQTELEALHHYELNPEHLRKLGRALSGARRPLRVDLSQALVHDSEDEYGGFIELSFTLPPGSYATVVLREVIAAAERTNEEVLHIDQP